MNLERLRALIDLVATSAITELEIEEAGQRLRISRCRPSAAGTAPPRPAAPPPVTAPTPFAAPAGSSVAPSERLFVAPMYGIFHAAPTPGEPPFVAVGQEIVLGQMLCILEAMKVFNTVHADSAGRIEEILIENGMEVEAGQPLFRLA